MKIFKKLFVLAMVMFMITACGSSGGDDGSNDLVIYSPNSEGLINSVIPLFEEQTGIKVELLSAGTGELIKRIEAEQENPNADILFGGGFHHYVQNQDLFEHYVSSEDENVVEEYRNKVGYMTYTILDGSVLVVNKELTEGMDIKGYKDLLNQELKGKIATADPANSSSAFAQLTNMLLAMSDDGTYTSDVAWEYVEDLVELWDGKIQSGSSSVYKSVVDGEMYVGLTYEDPVATLVKNGADNIEIVYPEEGTVFLPASSGIIKNAKNMENAQKFIDFLLSEEVQNIFGTELTNRPVRIDAEVSDFMTPFDDIHLIFEDIDYVSEHETEIVERYMDIYTSAQ